MNDPRPDRRFAVGVANGVLSSDIATSSSSSSAPADNGRPNTDQASGEGKLHQISKSDPNSPINIKHVGVGEWTDRARVAPFFV
jgi:hypothetical protein